MGGLPWRSLWWYALAGGLWCAALGGLIRTPDLETILRRPAFPLFAGWTGLAALFSPEPFLSVEQAALVVTGGLVYFSAAVSFDEADREAFFKTLVCAAFVCAALVLCAGLITGQAFSSCGFLFPPGVNYTAGLVAAGAAAAFSMLCDPGYDIRYRRAMWIFWAFMTAMIVLMRSRGALAGELAAVMMVLAVRGRYRVLAGFVLAGLAALVVMPGGWLGYLIKADDAFAFSRPEIWKTALSAALDNPLFGLGPGRFERYFLLHQFPSFDGFVYYGRYTGLAHCQPLQVAAETGVAGAVFYLCFIAGSFFRTVRLAQPQIKTLAAAAALFAASLVSETLFLPVNFMLFMLLLGVCGPLGQAAPESAGKAARAVLALFAALWVAGAACGVFRIRAAGSEDPGILARAAVVYPYDAQLWALRAASAAAEGPGSLCRARAFMERAAELYPTNAVYLYRLAGFEAASGDVAAARGTLLRAARLEPNSPALNAMLAKTELALGDAPAGRAALKKAALNAARFGGLKPRGGYARILLGGK